MLVNLVVVKEDVCFFVEVLVGLVVVVVLVVLVVVFVLVGLVVVEVLVGFVVVVVIDTVDALMHINP